MIDIQLKAKHYFLAAEILFGVAAYESFSTIEKIKNACVNAVDDDLVTINIDGSKIAYVYNILTYKPEGQFNQVNSEMGDLLLAQITAGVQTGNPEWLALGEQINSVRQSNLAVVAGLIAAGKAKLYS
jgi:hypothetical protein